MARKLVAVRVDPVVVGEFRELAKREGLGLGFAVQRLMESALTCRSVGRLYTLARQTNPRLERADVSRFKSAMVELSGEFGEQLHNWTADDRLHLYTGAIMSAVRAVQDLMPLIDDASLLTEANRLIAESMTFVKASEIDDAEARRRFLAEAEKIIGEISPELRRALDEDREGGESNE